MSSSFHDQFYIITGGASGIGWATAATLIRMGARVEIWDSDAQRLNALTPSDGITTRVVDVRDGEQVTRTFAAAAAHIDGVIHSAGILHTGLFEAMPASEHAALVAVNLGGATLVAHAALPYLRESRGSLVFVGSVSGFIPSPEFASYAASKAGVFSLAQSLRTELHQSGVHIGIANPLFVASPMLDERARNTRSFQAKSPLLHVYSADAVADSIVRGIARRQFMIWTGMRPRLIYAVSRYGAWLLPFVVRSTWR